MQRNTFLFVLLLAVIAAFLIGFNIRKSITGENLSETPVATIAPTPIPAPTIYTNTACGITIPLPDKTTIDIVSSESARLVDDNQEIVYVACAKEIPRFAIPATQIETATIAGVPAKLYHTTSAKDGTPYDAVIFRNPKTAMDISISGLGATFSAIVTSIELLK